MLRRVGWNAKGAKQPRFTQARIMLVSLVIEFVVVSSGPDCDGGREDLIKGPTQRTSIRHRLCAHPELTSASLM